MRTIKETMKTAQSKDDLKPADLKSWMELAGNAKIYLEKELSNLLFDDFPLFLVITSADGRILTMNKALQQALQCSPEEIMGRPLSTYIPEADHSVLVLMFGRMSMGQQQVKMETRLTNKDGREYLVEWSGRTVAESSGQEMLNLLAGIDITELWQSNNELKQMSDYLENILENSPDAIGIVDQKGRFIKWNRMAEQIYGYSFEELRGSSAFDMYADQSELEKMLAQLSADGFIKNFEIGMKRKDGTVLPFEVSLTVLRGKDNTMLGSVCVARDLSDTKRTMNDLEATNRRLQEEIEERRRTWAALEESQNLYRTIFENTGNAMVIVEENSIISLANAEFVKLSSSTAEEIEGKKTWTEFFKDESLQAVVDFPLLQRAEPNGMPRNFEASFADIEGILKYVYVTIAAIPGTRKSVVSFLDISKRKQAEEELRRSNEELEQRSHEISQLNEMLDLLQVCQTIDEIYYVIGRYVRRLFPADSGKLFLLQDDSVSLEVILEWGDNAGGEKVFAFNDCWALRQGKIYVVGDPGKGVACRHVGKGLRSGYLCVPLISDGKIKGLFHLQSGPISTGIPQKIVRRIMDSKQRLAVAVTDHISLALANYSLRETLRMQSIRDPLTGLYNRRFMEETLDRELSEARRTKATVVIMMLDIDFFKQFNDTHGHEAGDELLKEIGAVLRKSGRVEDVACRYGGEEFLLIMPGMDLDIAQQRAEKIRNRIGHLRINHEHRELDPVTASIGIAVFNRHGETAVEVVKAADSALYQAKNQGRNRVVVASVMEEK
jgi:diguanylate cyclase (GGDEF)-like protein/PAS domain S-box-containing protein